MSDPIIPQSNISSTMSNVSAAMSSPITMSSDARTSSVAELRRKAQEHSAALLHSLHAVAVSGLTFPGLHFPPSWHHALANRNIKNGHQLASDYINDLSLHHNNNHNSNQNNNIISKTEPHEKSEQNTVASAKNQVD